MLIYINNRLAPELEWFDVELARHPAEPEVEVASWWSALKTMAFRASK
jgi:hypothetical protein